MSRDFQSYLRSFMRHLDYFVLCLADPNVWMRPAKKADETEYYEYILLYVVDDALCTRENTKKILPEELGQYFKLKEESVDPLTHYLGG